MIDWGSAWWHRPGFRVTLVLLVLMAAAAAVAMFGIVSARRDAEAIALQDLQFQAVAQARTLEATLASRRSDLLFLSQSPPLANASRGLTSEDALVRRWNRLDIEATLLLFLAAHPEVESILLLSGAGERLVHAGRRDGAPVIFAPEDPDPGSADRLRLLEGRWPLGGDGGGQGWLEGRLSIDRLIEISGPVVFRNFRLLTDPSEWEDPSEAAPAGGGSEVRASIRDEGWSPPVNWMVVQAGGNLMGSILRLAESFRTTLILNLVLVGFSLVLGWIAFHQVRRGLALEAENRQQAKIRELERQMLHSERLASVGRLAAGMAHEINNPLEGMANYLALLEEDFREGPRQQTAELITQLRAGLNRAAAITRRVLAYADPGRAPMSALDLNPVLKESIDFVGSNPAFRDVELRSRGPASPTRVQGNGVLLSQLFLNLLLNACEIQSRGGIVEVGCQVDGHEAVIVVADRGPGIVPEDLPRLFEPFFSGRGSTGLGLSVCLGIVQVHRGTIEARNREGGGAELMVRLPLAEREEEA